MYKININKYVSGKRGLGKIRAVDEKSKECFFFYCVFVLRLSQTNTKLEYALEIKIDSLFISFVVHRTCIFMHTLLCLFYFLRVFKCLRSVKIVTKCWKTHEKYSHRRHVSWDSCEGQNHLKNRNILMSNPSDRLVHSVFVLLKNTYLYTSIPRYHRNAVEDDL